MRGIASPGERSLFVYESLARFRRLGYAAKIMLVAFVGIHVPLIALLAWLILTRGSLEQSAPVVGVVLGATLAGTGATVYLLHHLLRPIALTSHGLRRYVQDGVLPELPTHHEDVVGTLMADTSCALRRLDAAIDELEQRDEVTGLPNRNALLRALTTWTGADAGAPFAIAVLQLIGLDAIVSAFGRRASDRMLQLVAQRLESELGPNERLHRVGGDTFAVAMVDGDSPKAIEARLSSLRERLRGLRGGEQDTTLDCRAGVAIGPIDDTDPENLLDDAFVALHMATRRHRPITFYSEPSRRSLVERHTLMRDLQRALRDDRELALHYQPMVDVRLRLVVGAEALIRWRHPDLGLLPPARFIALAEESGLIEQLDRWTLRTACGQIRHWREQGVSMPPIAINLSARQFTDPDLPRRVGEQVDEYGVQPGSLDVELTETSALDEQPITIAVMQELRALGVGIAIDDFGTGHASMSRLRSMPFSKLKIDREFVKGVSTNADKRAICRSLIALARELRLDVLAEGTETIEEVEALLAEGCQVFQGYHFHRPMPAAALTRLFVRGDLVCVRRDAVIDRP